jgi:sugar (pentulose or hexulose) kinase
LIKNYDSMKETIAVFDVGKTNKKILLFDQQLQLVYQEEECFAELNDEDGFARDDVEGFLAWKDRVLDKLARGGEFEIKALNFSTYGATMAFLNGAGGLAAPVYNYLKPMPEDTLKGFYEKYGGVSGFSRKTASPALGMLNSGLQMLFMKKNKPAFWAQTRNILHFPQYLSYLHTGKITSEYTSIGCHTALWDFDNMKYHQWITDEGMSLPFPLPNQVVFKGVVAGREMNVGIGIHDSSASLVPYLKVSGEKNSSWFHRAHGPSI